MKVLRARPRNADLDEVVLAIPRALDPQMARDWTARIIRARSRWTGDFGGEQHSLGRAFYTHFETDRASLYFRSVASSDALVERVLPGMQRTMRDLFARLADVNARQRPGFAGAGAHIFQPGSTVSRRGGVVHFDVEGLAPVQLKRRARALSLVVMLQPPSWGGGLRVWDALYAGDEQPSEAQLATEEVTLRYGVGDAVLMSSYRLHQIRPFRGELARISLTLHGVEVDAGLFETWF